MAWEGKVQGGGDGVHRHLLDPAVRLSGGRVRRHPRQPPEDPEGPGLEDGSVRPGVARIPPQGRAHRGLLHPRPGCPGLEGADPAQDEDGAEPDRLQEPGPQGAAKVQPQARLQAQQRLRQIRHEAPGGADGGEEPGRDREPEREQGLKGEEGRAPACNVISGMGWISKYWRFY